MGGVDQYGKEAKVPGSETSPQKKSLPWAPQFRELCISLPLSLSHAHTFIKGHVGTSATWDFMLSGYDMTTTETLTLTTSSPQLPMSTSLGSVSSKQRASMSGCHEGFWVVSTTDTQRLLQSAGRS